MKNNQYEMDEMRFQQKKNWVRIDLMVINS